MGTKIKNTIPFIIANKKQKEICKYLDVDLMKHGWDLHTENCIVLMNEFKEDLNTQTNISCSRTGCVNIVRRQFPQVGMYAILLKTSGCFF